MRKTTRRDFLVGAGSSLGGAVLLGPALAGCGPENNGSQSESAQGDNGESLTPVRFSEAVHNLGYINLYVAIEQGFFRDQGIDLRLDAAGGDSQAFAAVAGGSADFACGDSTLAVISREEGGPGLVIGEMVSRAQFFGVSTNIDSEIGDPSEFAGLTFVTSPPPNTNYNVLVNSLTEAGLDPRSDVEIITVNPGTEIGPMLAGQADIAVAYQPNVATAIVNDDANIVYNWAEAIGPFHNTGVMVLREYEESNPETVQRMANALEQASRFTYENVDRAKEIARAQFPDLEPDVVEAAIDSLVESEIISRTFEVNKVGWEALMQFGRDLDNCECRIDFEEIVDNSYAQEAS